MVEGCGTGKIAGTGGTSRRARGRVRKAPATFPRPSLLVILGARGRRHEVDTLARSIEQMLLSRCPQRGCWPFWSDVSLHPFPCRAYMDRGGDLWVWHPSFKCQQNLLRAGILSGRLGKGAQLAGTG
jgi:hypothetical protein